MSSCHPGTERLLVLKYNPKRVGILFYTECTHFQTNCVYQKQFYEVFPSQYTMTSIPGLSSAGPASQSQPARCGE